MKYPELWERAQKIADRIKNELIPTLPIKNNKHRSLISRAISGGTFNNSIPLMAYTALQEGLTEEEIYQLSVSRVKSYYIFIKDKSQIKTKRQEDLDYYNKIQKELGHT